MTPTETGQWNTPKSPQIPLKTWVPDRGCQHQSAQYRGRPRDLKIANLSVCGGEGGFLIE